MFNIQHQMEQIDLSKSNTYKPHRNKSFDRNV